MLSLFFPGGKRLTNAISPTSRPNRLWDVTVTVILSFDQKICEMLKTSI